MNFKSQRYNSKIPTIELIPMLNVMMAVLAFFVWVSTILSGDPEGIDVQLPSNRDTQTSQPAGTPAPVIVRLDSQNQILLGDRALSGKEQLFPEIQSYLAQNETGIVLLVADPQANYENVIQLLAEMRQVGGDRVSLGIQSE
jgi:biopolymer transport protein ExbD